MRPSKGRKERRGRTKAVNPCAEFFAQNGQAELASLLQVESSALAWEALTASPYSPGPVEDAEQVIRLVYHPIHVDLSTGDLKPSVVDEASSWGCSVQREHFCSRRDAWHMGARVARAKTEENPAKPRAVYAIALLSVAAVRGLQVSKKRGAAVYDTALPSNIAHADVCVVSPGRQERRSIRAQLYELACQGLEVAPPQNDF